ncbi:zpr1 zinc-finger domain protein [Nannochloropsis gaditana]|uniref:Zpr1 zinc-finger domain protein n=1 Tax=Nannochloropsis gaditana TaxID=72520 RepID=W7TP51_9STRA|nr:zpr1 zinc-finger domain protein [Nannochloropsis gaditana]
MRGEEGTLPFTFILDDPAGNSHVENPTAPRLDPKLRVVFYERTPSQDLMVGLQPTEEARTAGRVDDAKPEHKA